MHPTDTAAVRMNRIRAALIGVLLPALAAIAPCAAAQTVPADRTGGERDEQVFTFDIPAGPLGPALSRFALVTGHQLLAESRLVAGVNAAALDGTYPAEDALRHLLRGTGLTFDTVDERTHVLTRPERSGTRIAGQSGAGGTIRLSGPAALQGDGTGTGRRAGSARSPGRDPGDRLALPALQPQRDPAGAGDRARGAGDLRGRRDRRDDRQPVAGDARILQRLDARLRPECRPLLDRPARARHDAHPGADRRPAHRVQQRQWQPIRLRHPAGRVRRTGGDLHRRGLGRLRLGRDRRRGEFRADRHARGRTPARPDRRDPGRRGTV